MADTHGRPDPFASAELSPRAAAGSASEGSLETILEDMLALSAGEREEQLVKLQRERPQIARALRSHLEALEASGLLTLAAGTSVSVSRTSDHGARLSSPRIGRGADDDYELVEELGRGGMGQVFRAIQHRPIHREVAIKIGLQPRRTDGDRSDARFAFERQALASMSHQFIAKVFDAGATDDGRPFLVMELIQGDPLDVYCRAQRLDLRQRVELLRHVCLGVHHAHQKGVIHRDLKPSNILVGRQGDEHIPKVIDFGVARPVDRPAAEAATLAGAVIGTPEYMAPEQAAGRVDDIDTRTDVYALGVLAYETLTGCLPFSSERLRNCSYTEMVRILCEEEPPRPSARLQANRDLATTQGESCRTSGASLAATLRGDLDWVILQAMAKEPARRYSSAEALATDLQRFLDHEAVSARRRTTGYRLRKFLGRHRVPAAAAAIVFATLIASSVVSFSLYRQAQEQVRIVQEEKDKLDLVAAFQESRFRATNPITMGENIRARVVDALATADRERGADPAQVAARSEQLEALLADANFTNVSSATLAQDLLLPTMATIDHDFADKPLLRARLLHSLATTLRDIGLLREAEAPQRMALEIRRAELGERAYDTLVSMFNLGKLLVSLQVFDEAVECYTQARAGFVAMFGEDHEFVRNAAQNLAVIHHHEGRLDQAEVLYREILATDRRLGDAKSAVSVLNGLGNLLAARGRPEDALQLLVEALAQAEQLFERGHELICVLHGSIAGVLMLLERYDDAEAHYRTALERQQENWGSAHPHTVITLFNLGWMLKKAGRPEDAEPMLREALEHTIQLQGEQSSDAEDCHVALAEVLESLNRWEEAADAHAHAVEIARRRDPGGRRLLGRLSAFANALSRLGRQAECEPIYRDCLALCEVHFGPQDLTTATIAWGLGDTLRALGRLQEAEPLLRMAWRIRCKETSADHPEALEIGYHLGVLLRMLGRNAEARDILAPVVECLRSKLGRDHLDTLRAVNSLGVVLAGIGDHAGAEACYEEAYRGFLARLGMEHHSTVTAARNLAGALRVREQYDLAESLYRAAYEASLRLPPERAQEQFDCAMHLGLFLLGAGKRRIADDDHAAAVGALEASYPLLERCLGNQDAQTQACVAMLVASYEALHPGAPGAGHDRRAQQWRSLSIKR